MSTNYQITETVKLVALSCEFILCWTPDCYIDSFSNTISQYRNVESQTVETSVQRKYQKIMIIFCEGYWKYKMFCNSMFGCYCGCIIYNFQREIFLLLFWKMPQLFFLNDRFPRLQRWIRIYHLVFIQFILHPW